MALRPSAGQVLIEVSKSQDFSGLVISSSRRPLPNNTQHSQQTSMPPSGFELTISAGGRLQTYALDRAATGPCRPPYLDLHTCVEYCICTVRFRYVMSIVNWCF